MRTTQEPVRTVENTVKIYILLNISTYNFGEDRPPLSPPKSLPLRAWLIWLLWLLWYLHFLPSRWEISFLRVDGHMLYYSTVLSAMFGNKLKYNTMHLS